MMSLPPCMGGKRPRSPVEKLADLQGQADAEDEDNWRNSKRYLSEVCACYHCSPGQPQQEERSMLAQLQDGWRLRCSCIPL